MTAIEQYIKELVQAVKSDAFFSSARFLKEYREHQIESPVVGFLIAVMLKTDIKSEGFLGGKTLRKASLCFKIYSPPEKGGDRLLSMAVMLRHAVEKADKKGIIRSTEISPAEFNQNIQAITRNVAAELVYCGEGED